MNCGIPGALVSFARNTSYYWMRRLITRDISQATVSQQHDYDYGSQTLFHCFEVTECLCPLLSPYEGFRLRLVLTQLVIETQEYIAYT